LTANAFPIDPVGLAQALIARPSVTPATRARWRRWPPVLRPLGFALPPAVLESATARRSTISMPWSARAAAISASPATRRGAAGNRAAWRVDPFAGAVEDGMLHGRGAADMRAPSPALPPPPPASSPPIAKDLPGRISLLITGDEEARRSTAPAGARLAQRPGREARCLRRRRADQPTRLGEMVKIGRRGSLTGRLTVSGVQGHIAYPQLADNPIHRARHAGRRLRAEPPRRHAALPALQPAALRIDVATGDQPDPAEPAPASTSASTTSTARRAWSAGCASGSIRPGGSYRLDVTVSGEAFLTDRGRCRPAVAGAIREKLGIEPELSTSGGTRTRGFIRALVPSPSSAWSARPCTRSRAHQPRRPRDPHRVYDLILERYFRRMIPTLGETLLALAGLWRFAARAPRRSAGSIARRTAVALLRRRRHRRAAADRVDRRHTARRPTVSAGSA